MTDSAMAFSFSELYPAPGLTLASAERVRRPGQPPADRRRRVVLYSHDTFGLGHLRRNLAIAEELLAPGREFDVVLPANVDEARHHVELGRKIRARNDQQLALGRDIRGALEHWTDVRQARQRKSRSDKGT